MFSNTRTSGDDPILYENLELWMTRLPAPLKNIPIIELAIPGSHDSMTYTIQRNSDVAPDESALIRFCGTFFSRITKPIIFNWSVTQYESVVQQLNGGIRYFDLRLATKPNNETYFVHGLYGAEISQPLKEMNNWLNNHPNEIVILDFQHFYAFNEKQHRTVVNQILNIFNQKVCPSNRDLRDINLQWMNYQKYQVLIIYRNIIARSERSVWASGMWPNPWPDTVDTNQLINFLNKTLKERSTAYGLISQCLLTPSVNYVLRHIFGNLHQNLGIKCHKIIIDWVQRNHPGRNGINIIIADFIADHNFIFCKTVIQRNVSILKSSYGGWHVNS